jgi:hypothetical protein
LVPAVKKENFEVAIKFKGKNGTLVSLMAFTVFLKKITVNDVKGKFSTIVKGSSL